MSIQAALYAELTGDTDIATSVSTRIYPLIAPPEATLPFIVYQRIGADHQRHTEAAAGLVSTMVQITCVATSAKAAHDLAELVREAMDHFRGTLGSGGNTATVRLATLDNEIENFDPPAHAEEDGTYSVITEWTIWHTETVPTHS